MGSTLGMNPKVDVPYGGPLLFGMHYGKFEKLRMGALVGNSSRKSKIQIWKEVLAYQFEIQIQGNRIQERKVCSKG